MFKNSVFRATVNTKEWFQAAGIRAIKTMAQMALSMLTVGQAFIDVNWLNVISISAVAGIMSILTSIMGLPELKEKEESEEK